MKHPSTLDQMLLLLRKYAFLCGVALSLVVTLACCHAWTAHRPFHPDSFTPSNDPSMRALVEECHIARNTIAVSGWIHSDVWPGDGATLILTVEDGEKSSPSLPASGKARYRTDLPYRGQCLSQPIRLYRNRQKAGRHDTGSDHSPEHHFRTQPLQDIPCLPLLRRRSCGTARSSSFW